MGFAQRSDTECPSGHGALRVWDGKLRCWTCGWPYKKNWQGKALQPTDLTFYETRIHLAAVFGIHSVELTFPASDNFVTWCKKNGFVLEERLVDGGTLVGSDVGFNIRETFLRSHEMTFAKVNNHGQQEVALVSVGNEKSEQAKLLEFCRLACEASSKIKLPSVNWAVENLRILADVLKIEIHEESRREEDNPTS